MTSSRYKWKDLSKRIYFALALPSAQAVDDALRQGGAWVFRKAVDVFRACKRLRKNPRSDGSFLIAHLTPHFGDAIMLLPLVQALHDAHPGISIDLVCGAGAESIYRAIPFVRSVYAVPVHPSSPVLRFGAMKRIFGVADWYRHNLQDVHPAVCIMPRWGDDLFASIYLAYLIGAPRRIAFSSSVEPRLRHAPQRDRLVTQSVTGGNGLHEPQRMLLLARQSGLLMGHFTDSDQPVELLRKIAQSQNWHKLQLRLKLPSTRFAVLAPGATAANRIWPTERWVETASILIGKDFDVVLLSGAADRTRVEVIASKLNSTRVHTVAGSTTLVESIALVAASDLFIGSDSGPGHAAGALGITCAILFVCGQHVYPDHPSASARIRPLGPYVGTLFPDLQPDCKDACLLPQHCISTITASAAVKVALCMHERMVQQNAEAAQAGLAQL